METAKVGTIVQDFHGSSSQTFVNLQLSRVYSCACVMGAGHLQQEWEAHKPGIGSHCRRHHRECEGEMPCQDRA